LLLPNPFDGGLMHAAQQQGSATADDLAARTRPQSTAQSTIDDAEVAQFDAIAAQWWEPNGKTMALHKFNPVRVAYICEQVARQYGRDPKAADCLKGLRILDLGCGGGILCESLARLGGTVIGADPADLTIQVARRHAAEGGLAIDYRCTTVEDLTAAGERFDAVISMEVIEHVADVPLFIKYCAELVKPGGLFMGATINRTFKAFAFVIVGAEYVVRWIAKGTHQYSKFVTPQELETALLNAKMKVIDLKGANYNVLTSAWRLSDDTGVNYMLTASKAT